MIKDKYRSIFNSAAKLRNRGQYLESLNLFLQLESKYGYKSEILGMIATLYWDNLKDYKNGLKYSQRLVQKKPRNEMASLLLFHCLWDLGNHKEAKNEN